MNCSLSCNIYTSLREDIINLRLDDGVVIKEKEIAERFKVSTTPVRDALSRLSYEGYIDKLPNQGYIVRAFTLADCQNLFQYRRVLECAVISLVCRQATDNELEALYAETLEEKPTRNDSEGAANLNTQFHLRIAQLTRNPFVIRTFETTIDHISRILLHDRAAFDFEFFRVSHIDIMDAIRQRDIEKAQILLEKHILDSQARVLLK